MVIENNHSDEFNDNTAENENNCTSDNQQSDNIEIYTSFDDMNLSHNTLRGIYAYGFEKPSAIQQRAIVQMAQGKDVLAQAQSGTGKTAAFILGSFERIDTSLKIPQVLILSPTRELADQTATVATEITTYNNISINCCIGGTRMYDAIKAINSGIHVIVGTPGRVYDMMKRRVFQTKGLKCVIIDEADEMLSIGFKDQLYNIFQFIPNNTQVGLFSATLPQDAVDLSKNIMKNPVNILVKKEELTLEGIKQFYVGIDNESWKLDTLCDLYTSISITQAIIYCNSRRKVEWLQEKLNERDFTVSFIHSEMKSEDRKNTMLAFRKGESRILIATDIIARGIDVQQVSIVINYDIPRDKENYLHRIGRSGRFGRKGTAINLMTANDIHKLEDIMQFYNTQIKELPADLTNFS